MTSSKASAGHLLIPLLFFMLTAEALSWIKMENLAYIEKSTDLPPFITPTLRTSRPLDCAIRPLDPLPSLDLSRARMIRSGSTVRPTAVGRMRLKEKQAEA